MNKGASEETSRDMVRGPAGSPAASDLETNIPAGAVEVFGSRAPLAQRYVELLGGPGIERGLIGPREKERLWDRHVLNSAAMASHVEPEAVVVDIGSGAGLPGIPLSLARPDLRVTLVEPLLRRVTFLKEVIEELDLDVRVVRGRAEDRDVIDLVGGADVVTARAVAPLGKLAGWAAPLLRPGGRMVALKGESAPEEVERDRSALSGAGLHDIEVEFVKAPDAEPTRLVVGTMKTKMKARGRQRRRR